VIIAGYQPIKKKQTIEYITIKKRKEEDEVREAGAGEGIRTLDSLLGKQILFR
jgi:hypothetical protein